MSRKPSQWLSANHDWISTTASIVIGIATVFVSCQVNRIAEYQTDIQKLEHTPVIAFQNQFASEMQGEVLRTVADSLRAVNSGAPLRRLRFDLISMAVVKYKRSIQDQGVLYLIPVDSWYDGCVWSEPREVLFTCAPSRPDNLTRIAQLHGLVGKGYLSYRVRGVQHLFRLRYENLLDEDVEEYYLVNAWDYDRISTRSGAELLDKLTNYRDKGWILDLSQPDWQTLRKAVQKIPPYQLVNGRPIEEDALSDRVLVGIDQ